jgi:glutathione peroxidase
MSAFLLSLMLMMTPPTTLQNFPLTGIDGKPLSSEITQNKVVLIVNVASYCGFTKHYKPLEAMYRTYKNQGFVVIGVPSNNFGEQEPGSHEEIIEFCKLNYDVTFPMLEKQSIVGDDVHPLYAWLTSGGGNKELAGDIPWNFEKFIVGKDGSIVARFKFNISPDDPAVISAIEQALAEPSK